MRNQDWFCCRDDSDEDFDQHRKSKYTPYGPRPKRKYPREKKRKGIGPPAVVPPLPDFDKMLPRLQAYKVLISQLSATFPADRCSLHVLFSTGWDQLIYWSLACTEHFLGLSS